MAKMKLRYLLAAGTILLPGGPVKEPADPRIMVNDNRRPAGLLENGVLTVHLEVRPGLWYPQSDSGRSQQVLAFAESGGQPQIPGPMIRVPVGTTIRGTVRNLSDSALVVHGLLSRPAGADSTLLVGPNKTSPIEFVAGQAGTYFYWASTTGAGLEDRVAMESQLSGAIVVDAPGSNPSDRVFVMGVWHAPADSAGPKPWVQRDVMVINGKMWPYTERFAYAQGDSVHWRWVNPTADSHPMHLHGFFYLVESRGGWVADTVYQPGDRRSVVTELMLPGSTMSLSWVAERAGNWLFHCHFAFHVSHFLSLELVPDPADPGAPGAVDHSVHGMTGLVLGLEVKPTGEVIRGQKSSGGSAPRQIRLVARTASSGAGGEELYGFVVRNAGATAGDSTDPMLMLWKDEPVRITVVNQLRAPTSVHWHGIEIGDSYMDGVPGWSGSGDRLAPLVAPGDSFAVEFTPPRAGTYMYHAHSNEGHQIGSGLYAPLLVMERGAGYNAARDRVFLFGGEGSKGRINRQLQPDTVSLVAGVRYRLRIININTDLRMVFLLESLAGTMSWRALAKDGADLPASQATSRPASVLMGPGETADFEFTPAGPGSLRFRGIAHADSSVTVIVPLTISESVP